jgi:mRNA interferase RelE/StbE
MTYKIQFTSKAEDQLKKLDKNVQERMIVALERVKIRPYDFVKKLSGYPYYRLRVGDYRIIIDIKNEIMTILVIEVGHRKSIYK